MALASPRIQRVQVLDERQRRGMPNFDRLLCCACNHILYCAWVEHDDEGKARQAPIISPCDPLVLYVAPQNFRRLSVQMWISVFLAEQRDRL